jgi:hypothetical protein
MAIVPPVSLPPQPPIPSQVNPGMNIPTSLANSPDMKVLNQDTQEKPKQLTAIPDEWKTLLSTLLQRCEREDEAVHYAWVRKAKRLELYFNNIVTLFWDNLQNDWTIPNWDDKEADGVPPRIINIYRPHGESIIAALSVGVPSVLFFPTDADNADDIDKAENYTALVKIIQKHNKAKLLYIKILSILFNQGTPFVYSYCKKDRKFGFYQVEEISLQDQTSYTHDCPVCGNFFGEGGQEPVTLVCPSC